MQRIKIPFGGLNARQLEVLAELAEEYSDGIAHVTTRQDFQLHFVHIEDTPTIMRRLAAVGITTREACGNYGTQRHRLPDRRRLPRRKLSTSLRTRRRRRTSCSAIPIRRTSAANSRLRSPAAATKPAVWSACTTSERSAVVRRTAKRGFEFYVGGGLGTVPQQAKLLREFVPEEELLPLVQAIGRVFARLGEKKNRNTARLKFLVNKLGIDEFQRLVLEERAALEPDPRWTDYLEGLARYRRTAAGSAAVPADQELGRSRGFRSGTTNVYGQRQAGYATVTSACRSAISPRISCASLADIARKYTRETIRTTVEQNIVLRWVSEADLPALYNELEGSGPRLPGAGTIVDVVVLPRHRHLQARDLVIARTCGELRMRLLERGAELDEAIRGLHIKVSGCFNSCGQHHIADLGFYGVSRSKNGYAVPHFQVVLGGQWEQTRAPMAWRSAPCRRSAFPKRWTASPTGILHERTPGETFQLIHQAHRQGRMQEDGRRPDGRAAARCCARVLSGLGRCARVQRRRSGRRRMRRRGCVAGGFQLTAAEREVFEAQLELERGDVAAAVEDRL